MKPGTYTVSSGYGSRWGAFHAGLDFACPVGTPIYAPADGVVVQGKDRAQGSVSGFGSWIWLDCQASVGKDFIFGHVHHPGILVKAGDRVKAGQQIGVSGNEGKTTGPHVHAEVWGSPGRTGGKHQDPAPYFTGATAPGGTTTTTGGSVSTIFGVDVSYFQNGMSLAQAKREGMSFAIIRTNDGTFRDPCYRSHMQDAESAGLVTAAYAYLRNPAEGSTIRQQVNTMVSVMGDLKRPVWMDCENAAGLSAAHIREFKRLAEAAGVRVIGAYSYVPWWENSVIGGEPDSHEFGKFWVAGYPGGTGTPAQIYRRNGGDGARQWSYPLGNQLPAVWQFTDRGTVCGRQVDCNAFRGSVSELRAIFYGGSAATSEEDDMFTDSDRAALLDCRAMLQTLCAQDMGDANITGPFGGWQQTGGRTRTDTLAAIAAKLGVPGTTDTKEK
ncbi:MAG: peptidoglycan DD-metalloendopeptidase family protein [Acidipropionibacterium jensenii]|uniref:peptidoglycan DD-metalloendopeptidase family protein n=1 Tax=Acidipropionibacterium jensenii TaxID=1749 RepID=UPI002649174B|nr:peptidoglycan DD-metalloendopeptidase family protein [Acidipropionibacterium jensenii]MDN6440476.1 peptidoglycan DD-metalloendopeptidase family protein [Acidipropionibacterium jensenii]